MPFCILLDFLSLHHGLWLHYANRMSFFFFFFTYLLEISLLFIMTWKKKMTWNWHSALTMHVLKISHKCFSFPPSFQGQLSLEEGYSFIQIISKWIEYPRGTRINFVKTCTRSLKYWLLFFWLLLSMFWLRHMACRLLGPQLGMEPMPSAVEAWSLNHWTTREVPEFLKWFVFYKTLSIFKNVS